MPSLKIHSAMGHQPALNRRDDQLTIIDLLEHISRQEDGASSLPPATHGPPADFRFSNAIFQCQLVQAGKGMLPKSFCDGRADPPLPKPPVPKPKSAGFLESSTAGHSVSITEFGFRGGRMSIDHTKPAFLTMKTKMSGFGSSLDPAPFGVEIAPFSVPCNGSQIHAGPRMVNPDIPFDDLLGNVLIIRVSSNVGAPVGGNASAILFGIGAQPFVEDAPTRHLQRTESERRDCASSGFRRQGVK